MLRQTQVLIQKSSDFSEDDVEHAWERWLFHIPRYRYCIGINSPCWWREILRSPPSLHVSNCFFNLGIHPSSTRARPDCWTISSSSLDSSKSLATIYIYVFDVNLRVSPICFRVSLSSSNGKKQRTNIFSNMVIHFEGCLNQYLFIPKAYLPGHFGKICLSIVQSDLSKKIEYFQK